MTEVMEGASLAGFRREVRRQAARVHSVTVRVKHVKTKKDHTGDTGTPQRWFTAFHKVY